VRLGAGKENDPLLPPADEPIAELPEVSTATDAGQVCALHTEASSSCIHQQLCAATWRLASHTCATRLMMLGMQGCLRTALSQKSLRVMMHIHHAQVEDSSRDPSVLRDSQAAESAAAYAQSSAAGAASGVAKGSSASAEEDSGTKEFSAAFYRTRLISFAAMVVACASLHMKRNSYVRAGHLNGFLHAFAGHLLFSYVNPVRANFTAMVAT